jgi:mRNA-degrading endonuclease RelE of RelBE toxin-antitoxin system
MYEIELSRSAAKYYNDLDEKRARIINRCFETLSENPFYHPTLRNSTGNLKEVIGIVLES